MQFDIVTIFPEIFNSYFSESIISRAKKRGLIKINIHNLRDFTNDRHKTVDDKPYGGGPGMIMKVEPIYRAVKEIQKQPASATHFAKATRVKKASARQRKTKIILFSAKGKKFDQKIAQRLSKLDNLILICGRYEGVDERVAKYIVDMEVSVGDYVLTGGEIPTMIVVDAITRLLPGAIKTESLREESFGSMKYEVRRNKDRKSSNLQTSDFELQTSLEYPQYTRPEVFAVPAEARKAKAGARKKVYWRVPQILLSGHHKKIEEWRKKHQKSIGN